jgi:hypothetical protein
VESLCQSLNDLFTFQVIKQKEKTGEAINIGKITEWYKKPQAGVAKVDNASLFLRCDVFLVNQNISWCQSAKVTSIKIDDQSVSKINVVDETEVGLKFDVDGKEGLNLYLLKSK